jgi:Uma2 family endonuclease
LFLVLAGYLRRRPVGKLYAAPFDVYLDEINALQPDLVFVSKKQEAILTERGAEGAPDLVVEILSPKTAHLDKRAKRHVYARSGVRELWLVDPDTRTILVYALDQDAEQPARIYRGREVLTSNCFPGLRIHLREVFQR